MKYHLLSFLLVVFLVPELAPAQVALAPASIEPEPPPRIVAPSPDGVSLSPAR